MISLSNKQASTYAAIAFMLTLLLGYFLPGYTITLSGLLVVIFLSVFIDTVSSTLIAMVVSIIVVSGYFLLHPEIVLSAQNITEHLFVIFLIFFTTVLVLYMKRLYKDIAFDKNHMTALFENATEGIILTDSKGSIVLVNPAAERIFHYTADELIGQSVEVLIPMRYRGGHEKLRNGFYDDPQNRIMGWGRDLFAQRKGGEHFPVEVSLSHYKQGAGTFVIAFVVDITHRKEIERSMLQQRQQLEHITNEVRQLNAELEVKVEERTLILKEALQKLEQSQKELSDALDKERELSEIKSRFVSMASHEFRTPLSTVLSSASLLSKYTKAEDQPKRDRHINKIRESVKHLNDLLEDFLSLGKLDEGKVGANIVPFDLKEVMEDTVEDMKGLIKNGQQVDYRHTGESHIISDKKLLRNILINLLSNAIKFSEENSTVTVTSDVAEGQAVIKVKDKGMGISEEDQQHLFSSFFRGKNALNIQGTGLGLHIVKRYLDLIGGSVHLHSILQQGTTITLTIPVNISAHGKNNIGY